MSATERKSFAEIEEECRCDSCGFSMLSGDGRDSKCAHCGARLCVGCFEAVHHPGCVMGDPSDLDPFVAVKAEIQASLDRLFDQVYRYTEGTETAFTLMRDARGGLAWARGACSKVGHAWSGVGSDTCYACGSDNEDDHTRWTIEAGALQREAWRVDYRPERTP